MFSQSLEQVSVKSRDGLIVNYVDVNADDITDESRFVEDLGFNSYDFMSLLGELENEFEVTVDESDAIDIHTVGEAVKYLEGLKK